MKRYAMDAEAEFGQDAWVVERESSIGAWVRHDEAADELSRLRADVERLTGALEGALADSARLTLALSDERAHADAMAEALERAAKYIEGPMADRIGPMIRQCNSALAQHRARRSP